VKSKNAIIKTKKDLELFVRLWLETNFRKISYWSLIYIYWSFEMYEYILIHYFNSQQ
jgi:hypothetical protein